VYVLEVTFAAAAQTKVDCTSTDFGEVTCLVWKTAGAAMLFPKSFLSWNSNRDWMVDHRKRTGVEKKRYILLCNINLSVRKVL
jgi:hypothetical protein